MRENYNIIGLMSGTSMDGLDMAYCNFVKENDTWSFEILTAVTIPYSEYWLKRLNFARNLSMEELAHLDVEYGQYLGDQVLRFMKNNGVSEVDFVSSHGHTVHHKPEKGITVQIGNGQILSDTISLPVYYDFRIQDVEMGGQGAPLVPVGDKLLFSDFEACLNLGGFANISFESRGVRVAFDICPVNIVLNYLAARLGKSFDKDGEIGKTGELIPVLFEQLNRLPFYSQNYPKSLGIEWVEQNVYPLLLDTYSVEDSLFTLASHISFQVNEVARKNGLQSILVTGGGAFNSFLMESFRSNSEVKFDVPEKMVVEFKEAVVFAFLGLLKKRNEINVFSSVTGSIRDHSSGKSAFPLLKK